MIAVTVCVAIGCGGGQDPSSPDAPRGGADAVPPAISIENLSATVAGTNVQCATNGSPVLVACPTYTFRFVIRNAGARPIAVLDTLRLAFDGDELYNATAGICTLPPWTVAAGAQSTLITIGYTYLGDASAGFEPWFTYECGVNSTHAYAPGPRARGDALPSLPIAGTVTLSVEGILSDASGFVAASPTVLNP